MKHRYVRSIIIIAALFLLLVLTVSFVHDHFTSQVPGANDFLPRWKGAVLFIQEGRNPYSLETTESIQIDMYGRLARPDEDQVAFAYPFYTVFLLAPLISFNLTYAMASAIWIVFLLMCIFSGLIITVRLVDLKMPSWLMLILFICAFMFYNSLRTLILGQFAALVFLLIAASLFSLTVSKDYLAGALLALSTVKPQMVLFLIAALLVWGISQKRYRFIASFVFSLSSLLALSFLLLPTWMKDFLYQMTHYVTYTEFGSPISIVTHHYFPQLGTPVETLLISLVLVLIFYQWVHHIRTSESTEQLLSMAMITLPTADLIIIRTATTNQIVLFLPILWVISRALQRNALNYRKIAVFFITTCIIGWLLFLTTHNGRWENPIMFLYLPVVSLILLIWDKESRSRFVRIHKRTRNELPN